ncbi:MAG: hypothetical protein EBU90_04795 [Proteobacteria bacterium]|nr:hypothetical protein [Pseudomonadota bacterium]NBP13764.1 hypothetical protein [bacterium]
MSFQARLEKDNSIKYKEVVKTFRQFELFEEMEILKQLVNERNYVSTVYAYRLKLADNSIDTELFEQIANNRYVFYKLPALASMFGCRFDETDLINAVICEDKRTLKIVIQTDRLKTVIAKTINGKPFLFEMVERAVGCRKYSVRTTFILNWCDQFVKQGAQSTWYDTSNQLIWTVCRYLEYLRCSYRITRRKKTHLDNSSSP